MKEITDKPLCKSRECHIVSSIALGPEKDRLGKNNAYVIAADAGYKQAFVLGITPDLIVGDFDSAPRPDCACQVIELPEEKDDTDTVYAVKQALEKGFNEIRLFGAWGGRADHSMANLQLLLYIAGKGANGAIECPGGQIYCLGPGRHTLEHRENSVFSVLAAGGTVKGVYIENGKYPLNNAVLTADYPVGVSNEFCGGDVFLSISEGYAYVFILEE